MVRDDEQAAEADGGQGFVMDAKRKSSSRNAEGAKDAPKELERSTIIVYAST